MAWLFQWGSTRHAANTVFLALVAADKLFKDNVELYNKYKKFAKDQMEYFFGKNNLGLSYVIGMGEKNPKSVHHQIKMDHLLIMLAQTKILKSLLITMQDIQLLYVE